VVFGQAGRKARGHPFLFWPRCCSPPSPSLARFSLTLPPLPQNSRKSPRADYVTSAPHRSPLRLLPTRLTSMILGTRSPYNSATTFHTFPEVQAQSGHAGSLQRDGVLPPTRAAGRFPSRFPARPESAKRFTHTVHTLYCSIRFTEIALVAQRDR
jgi:hypothetical protein